MIVAGENGLVKFCNAIVASRVWGCTRKLVGFVRSSPLGPRFASMYETSPTAVTMLKHHVHTPEAISRKTFRRLTKEKAILVRENEKNEKRFEFRMSRRKCSVPVS